MTNRPTFTRAELERATAVAVSLGCEVVIEKTAEACTVTIKKPASEPAIDTDTLPDLVTMKP